MIEQLIHRIKVRQTEIQISLADGMPMNWESYQRMVGEFQGLRSAMDMIDNMLDEEKHQD
jgi:hypothetical protein